MCLFKLSNVFQPFINTAEYVPCIMRQASFLHGKCTAVFLLTSTFFFLQMKSACFNKSDKLPVANC